MSVQKFRTHEEAKRALWCFNPDDEYYERVSQLFKLANQLCPPDFPRGVFKYRTIEDANKAKEEWLLQNALKKNQHAAGPTLHSP